MTLPNFLVIGVGKCGTTSLYHHFNRHPQIFMSSEKEPQYFAFGDQSNELEGPGDDVLCRTVPPDLTHYNALFSGVREEVAIGEASTATIYEPRACNRVWRTIPDARLIAILRNPAERAFSDYLHKRRTLIEPCHRFEDALEAEPWRIQNGWSYRFHYRQRGLYYQQLKPFFETFDRGQIKVVILEDLAKRPDEVFAEMYSFLGVDDSLGRSDLTAQNVSPDVIRWPRLAALLGSSDLGPVLQRWRPFPRRVIRNLLFVRPTLAPALRLSMIEYYRGDIIALQDLIERDLSHWLAA